MYSFRNDYSEGAHPAVLKLLQETNFEQSPGYGEDIYCLKAKELIRQEIKRKDADIHFICGGTQANLLAISAALRPHEAVIAAETGHICVHEAGAIESTGHKIIMSATPDGKLTPELILPLIKSHTSCHMVKPRLVFISNSTEMGTVYDADEIKELHAFCREHDLLLYLDGARLGTALTVANIQLTLADIAAYTDCFYIGGTKNGALLGEAMVITHPAFKYDFDYQMKQKGALMAKGRLLGLQFLALFTDGLYYDNARHANEQAQRLKQGIKDYGYPMISDSPTNQLFVSLPQPLATRIIEKYPCELIQEAPDELVVRFVTSWATQAQAVDALLADLGL